MQKRGVDMEVWQEAAKAFVEFCSVIEKLRDPVDGCPWDLKQNHESLRQYMVEEAYEAFSAMTNGGSDAICEELGDVLLQVVLNSQIAKDQRSFTITDVVRGITEKIVRRHPHVFEAAEQGGEKMTPEQVKLRWDEIKTREKRSGADSEDNAKGLRHYFQEAGVEGIYPANKQAYRVGKLAKKINFDWESPEDVLQKFLSEVDELREAWETSKKTAHMDRASLKHLRSEIGDLYFSLAQFCRHLKMDPETVALEGNQKFLKRFACVEKIAFEQGLNVKDCSAEALNGFWEEAKKITSEKD